MHDLIADAALIVVTCAYARWLDESKDLEPDFVWLEVVAGTMLCLAHAHAGGRRHGGDWRAQQMRTVRAFVLGGIPIIIGELAQWLRRREERRRLAARWE